MTELTGKQKRHLRSLGQRLTATVTIGRQGAAAGVRQVGAALESAELVKVRLPAGPGPERRAMGERIAEQVGAACAGVVGRTALIYRPNQRVDDEKRIELPRPSGQNE